VIAPCRQPTPLATSPEQQQLQHIADYGGDCSEAGLARLRQAVTAHEADVIIGIGGGKALDAAKLLADQQRLPVVTIPTRCNLRGLTALSNVYSDPRSVSLRCQS